MKHRRVLLLAVLFAACGNNSARVVGGDDAGADAATSDAGGESDVSIDADSDATPGDANTLDAMLAPDVTFPVELPHVRIMAANLTTGNDQSYEDPGIRIFQGLKPDVVLIQEFKYATTLRDLVDTAFGTSFSYYVEPQVGGIPNGIVSRYPILSSGTWVDASVTDRAFVWAQIDVPGPIDLWAVSLHLLTTDETHRDTEAQQLLGYIQANIPPDDYLVVGGDLNTDAVTELALIDLANVAVVAPPFPQDQTGNTFTSTNRNRPHDWVLARPNLDALSMPVMTGFSTYPSGLVFDSRVYTPLTDVPPILATDSATAGMQHMGVVRDFAINDPAAIDAGTNSGDAGDDASD